MSILKLSTLEAALAAEKDDGEAITEVAPKDVFSDIALRLQLLAIGCSEWLKRRTCCCCCPVVSIGGFVVCSYALLRGLARLNEVLGPVHLILEYTVENPWAVVVRVLMAVAGLGDVVAGALGLYGFLRTRRGPVAVLFLWLCISLLMTLLAIPLEIAFDTVMGGHSVAVFGALLEIAIDMYHLFVSFQLLLLVTYKASVSDDVDELLCEARDAAAERGDSSVTTEQILASLLQNDIAREYLSGSPALASQLGSDPAESKGTFQSHRSRTVKFSAKANELVAIAAGLQQAFGHRKLQ
eukprot:3490478-Amphidinium_carterae.1